MLCSNCGQNVPFGGRVCPWCHADKSGDQLITVLMFFGGLVGGAIGAGIAEVIGGIVGFIVGAIVMMIVGMNIKSTREARTGGAPILPNLAATLQTMQPDFFSGGEQAPPTVSAVDAESCSEAFLPTHVVPAAGLSAWKAPDPAEIPIANLAAGVELRLAETLGEWAHVVAENGWEGWVDGRLLRGINDHPDAAQQCLDGEGVYDVQGVDRESGLDTRGAVHAASRANAKVKAELQGIIVTAISRR